MKLNPYYYSQFTHILLLLLVWSPALRTGHGWKDYIQFDFRTNTRLNRVMIAGPEEDAGVRTPTHVTIQVHSTCIQQIQNTVQIRQEDVQGTGHRIQNRT